MKKIYIITVSVITISIAFFAYNFFTNQKTGVSEAALSRNGLTLDLNFGNNNGGATPTIYDTSGFNRNAVAQNAQTCNQNNCIFDSGDNMITSGNVYNTLETSIVLKFSPTFAPNDGVLHYIFDSTNGSRYGVYKNSNSVLGIILGGTVIQDIPLATYEPYWKTNQENVLIISGSATTDRTDVYLNGTKILDQDTTAWTEANPATIYIGTYYAQSSYWANSTFHYFKVWNRLLTDNEVANLSADRKTSTQAPSRTGLVGHWSMDSNDINGTTVLDKSGYNYNGVGVNITSDDLVKGKISQALDFDGSTEYIGVSNPTFLDDTQGTISFWVIKDDLSAVDSFITSSVDGSTDDELRIDWSSTTLKQLQFVILLNSGVNTVLTLNNAIIDNNWHLITFTSNGSTIKLYIDGVNKTLAGVNTGAWFNTATDANIFSIGVLKRASLLQHFGGDIDDVRIYNYALSAEEVANLYSATKTEHSQAPSRSGLVGYWTMDEEDINGTTVLDKSGQNRHGTRTGASGDNNTPQIISGKIGQALDFDGSDDYISLSKTSNLPYGANPVTISAWAKVDAVFPDKNSTIFCYGSVVSSQWRALMYNINTGIVFSGLSNDVAWTTDTSQFVNKWKHIVGIYDGTNAIIYVDGVEQARLARAWNTVENLATIGVTCNAGPNQFFNGSIDDVRIYDYALSAEEVAGLYSASKVFYMK